MTSFGNATIVPMPEATEADSGGCLPLSEDMAWFANLLGRMPRGANLLVGGDPGVGKSTLVQQIALSAALAGERVLIIATEQSRVTLLSRMTALSAPLGTIAGGVEIIDDIGDLALLPQLLARQVFARNGRLNGTDLIIIDSLHGLGNGPNDKRFYSAIFEYLRTASASGISIHAIAIQRSLALLSTRNATNLFRFCESTTECAYLFLLRREHCPEALQFAVCLRQLLRHVLDDPVAFVFLAPNLVRMLPLLLRKRWHAIHDLVNALTKECTIVTAIVLVRVLLGAMRQIEGGQATAGHVAAKQFRNDVPRGVAIKIGESIGRALLADGGQLARLPLRRFETTKRFAHRVEEKPPGMPCMHVRRVAPPLGQILVQGGNCGGILDSEHVGAFGAGHP